MTTARASSLLRAGALVCALAMAAGCVRAPQAPAPRSLTELSAEDLYRKAAEFAGRGDWVGAEQYLQAARRAGFDERRVTGALVRVCLASERYQTALSYAEPYLMTHPEDWPLRQVVAAVYMSQGHVAHARSLLLEVAQQAPFDAETRFMLGALSSSHGEWKHEARDHFEAYLALAPTGEHAQEARHWLRTHPQPVSLDVHEDMTEGGQVTAENIP